MAEIKFKKVTELPSSPTSADDGVYFVRDKEDVFSKIAIISGGVIKEYTPEGGGTTYTAGKGIDITDDEISLKQATDTEIGGVKIWKGTRSDYNAIPTKDDDTIYFIEDEIIPTIATFIIDKEHIISSTSSFVLSLESQIPTEIWDKVIDWKITWKDASGLHNLRDFVSKNITKIYLANRSTTGNFELSVEKNSLEPTDVTIPAGAKLILILEE